MFKFKKQCKECKDLPEGEVITGHDHSYQEFCKRAEAHGFIGDQIDFLWIINNQTLEIGPREEFTVIEEEEKIIQIYLDQRKFSVEILGLTNKGNVLEYSKEKSKWIPYVRSLQSQSSE